MKFTYNILTIFALLLLSSCGERPKDVTALNAEAPIFPDYIGVTVPATISPLNFNIVSDGDVTSVDVTVQGSHGGEMHTLGKWAKFDIDEWHKLTEANAGGQLTFTVCAKIDGKWVRYNPFNVYVSPYPLDQWGITYRRIAPGYEVYSTMGLYQRDLSNFKEYPIIENKHTAGQCYNCHTSCRTNPDLFVFHVRGDHGATMIYDKGKCTWLQAVNDSLGGAMVYPYWHPSGRYCAFSTNQTRQAFHISGEKRLEVFDYSSDILVYDVEKREIILDTIAATKDWSENTPVFAPDGKSIYFTTCLQKSYPLEYKDEQYNLCRIDFDPDSGRLGEAVDTIFDAVAMGKSVTWPRPSYDGRYLMFTLQDYGYFSIWHPESEQWLLNLDTGEARKIDEINSDNADSYHNWSANSRWIVFTSRRDDGLYTRLYLSSIDDDGNFTKPFLLPQYNPMEYYDDTLYSFNTPDFTQSRVDFDANSAVREINSGRRETTHIRK